jgi:UDP-N-acetylglucosamine--N-acetylmuramyl-(pentapeptide) pyrophosphoryl-undecaprenol N-acetylglucosamine transferase
VIAGGGTGGHLYPGIAVARELLSRVPQAHISFAGTAAGIEARVLPREGFALDVIRSAGLKGKSAGALVRGFSTLPASAWDAWRLISRRSPDLVIGVGGYSSGPVVLLAALRGIPTLLMEQNATPGITNRLLGRVARAVAVTYESSRAWFGRKAFVSGNPVRPEFLRADRNDAAGEPEGIDRAPEVLIFGGSQGAHAINVAMVEAAPGLAAGAPRVAITHQTGERDLAMVREGYRRAGLEARVEPFLYAMDREMRRAAVVVCRAGATTLAELPAVGRAAILVPLPTAADDHQRRNAEAFVAAGAAEMIAQRDLDGPGLAARILALAGDVERRRRMEAASRRLARPDAARVIADRALELIGAPQRVEG